MKAMILDTYFRLRTGKVCDKRGNVAGLIMEHHSKNIETRTGIWMLEASRLVNEYAQLIHSFNRPCCPFYKEKVAGITSCHLREDFPPHPDDPSSRKDRVHCSINSSAISRVYFSDSEICSNSEDHKHIESRCRTYVRQDLLIGHDPLPYRTNVRQIQSNGFCVDSRLGFSGKTRVHRVRNCLYLTQPMRPFARRGGASSFAEASAFAEAPADKTEGKSAPRAARDETGKSYRQPRLAHVRARGLST